MINFFLENLGFKAYLKCLKKFTLSYKNATKNVAMIIFSNATTLCKLSYSLKKYQAIWKISYSYSYIYKM